MVTTYLAQLHVKDCCVNGTLLWAKASGPTFLSLAQDKVACVNTALVIWSRLGKHCAEKKDTLCDTFIQTLKKTLAPKVQGGWMKFTIVIATAKQKKPK